MASSSGTYHLLPNTMMGNIDRIFSKETYDRLDIYQDFKNHEDFLEKRKIWGDLSYKKKRFFMLLANIQNGSQKVFSWQIDPTFTYKKVDSNLHVFLFAGKSKAHGKYKTILNILDRGEDSFYIHIEDSKKIETRGRFKESYSQFVIDFIDDVEQLAITSSANFKPELAEVV